MQITQIIAIVVSFALTIAALAVLVPAVRKMLGVIRRGQPAPGRSDNAVGRGVTMLKETFLHTRMLQWHWVGIMHWFVYMAFLFLSTAVLAAYFQLFKPDFAWPVFGHWYVYEWFSEIIGLLSTIGIVFLIIYRQKHHPRSEGRKSRFFGSTMWQAYFVEALALLEGAAILFVRGAEWLLPSGQEAGRSHFPISSWIGDAIYPTSEVSLENLIYAIATFKIALAMIWLMIIARNITMGIAWHRFTAWFNIFYKRESDGSTALGAMKPLTSSGKAVTLDDLDDLDEDSILGAGSVEDFSWKGILDFTTCTECGRCQSQCPAWNTEKPLSPKLLITALRDHAYAKADGDAGHSERSLVGSGTKGENGGTGTDVLDYFYNPTDGAFVIDEDVLWNCTSCGACVQQCPVDIEHVDHIMDMRRYQVLVESNFPAELNGLFKGLENKGNPWNMSSTARMDWAKGLEFDVPVVGEDLESLESVDWLFWVGCAGAYEDRAKKTTRAVAELLNMAGVSFGVLGNGETCTGDPARRAGNEFVFQGLAAQNVETFKEFKVKKVVSTCAHCFNTLKNEYKDFGIELEVVHHTQLLNRLVREGKLTPVKEGAGAAKRSITYHDPCYLGRHNDVYTPPRELLEILPGAEFTEMERNSEKSFCCGAGGARMWMEENIGERINLNRTKEAVGTGADQIAVGCPFCRVMLSDGLTAEQAAGNAREEVEVLDVAQMLLASVKGESAIKAAAGSSPSTTAPADVATKAEPEAGDVTVTEDTITETADAGPAAEASGGSSLFDTPAPAKAETAATSSGGSLFDTPSPAEAAEREPVEAEPAESVDTATETTPSKPAADLGSGGSLFDLAGPQPTTKPAAKTAAEPPSAEQSSADAPEADVKPAPVAKPAAATGAPAGSTGSLFDIAAPEPAPSSQAAPEAESVAEVEAEVAVESEVEAEVAVEPQATTEPTTTSDTSAAPATASSDVPATSSPAAAGTPATSIPEGSLFDIEAPAPTAPAPAPAPGAATATDVGDGEDGASDSGDSTTSDATAPEATASSDVPETTASSDVPDAREKAPAEPALPSTPASVVSTPATSIPESGSLFDIEAPAAAPTPPAPVAAAAPAAEAEVETAESVEEAEAAGGSDGAEEGPTDTLSSGAALSQAATFPPSTDAVETEGAEEPAGAEPDAQEPEPAEPAEATEPEPEAAPAKSTAPKPAAAGDVHTPKTDVDIHGSGSLFDL
ncbi:heterodisulfide reductase-related iron-sulfur binding cluster [Nocardioides sp.]|uniref:heterodisulfide reductase-related iron-sulfur binding cluster n=1 Tax=Nocardioides sp. TaxID=35761 RepID=UPI002CE23AF3|nr:heterodisulfide reductase-related iron-sulfur binding cluster [Nocardioides sp.]HXH80011.1 heterodisulfide reductase-related iron-sulfur binding cluster [Nocardioides sp.]